MKKLITLLLFALFVSVNSYSQTATRKYEYAIVQLRESDLIICYGNKKEEDFNAMKNLESKGFASKHTNNMVDALNYMDEQGYELVSSVSVGAITYQYTFRREIKK